MKAIKIIGKIIVCIFAVIGFILTAGFFAVKYNLTNVLAVVDKNNDKYQEAYQEYLDENKTTSTADSAVATSTSLDIGDLNQRIGQLNSASQELIKLKQRQLRNLCEISLIGEMAPANAKNILLVYKTNPSDWVFDQMVLAVSLHFQNNDDFMKRLSDCQNSTDDSITLESLNQQYDNASGDNIFPWANTESWQVVERAVLKDEAVIKRAAAVSGVSPRTMVSILIVEQLRLYNTQREYFEKFFKPLEILASANKMAWGVMAIKEKAAIDIENNLKNPSSAFYPGDTYGHLLDFSSRDQAGERYSRLTDEHNHYYSYLYGGLLIKELITQWQKAGYDLSSRPEVISTLFNIGFTKSKPKADPQVGGSIITISDTDYTFGSLSHEFYYSGLLGQFGY